MLVHQSGPVWLEVLAWVSLGLAFLCAGLILFDVFGRGRRQKMAIMNWVWPITALYWGPVALSLYFRRGRRTSRSSTSEDHGGEPDQPSPTSSFARRNWWPISKGVAHCGAGCTLGDITGEWIIYATGLTIGGFALASADELIAMFVLDFTLAWTYGIVFQYFSIVPMREDMGRLEGIWAAIKADTLSIVSFQLGLFGWMALYHLVIFKPPLTTAGPTYWFMMQIGMVIGFFTAWPVNAWLIQIGWKEKM